MTRVLFVCTGNTCRSPLAEAIFEHKKTNGDLEAASAGIHGSEGMPMSEGAKRQLEKRGIMESHQGKPLEQHMITSADLILTMTENHKDGVRELYPEAEDRLFTVKEYAIEDEETQQKIAELKEEYRKLEETRKAILQEHQAEVEDYNQKKEKTKQQEKLEEKLLDALQPHQSRIDRLAWDIPALDIRDPFGAGDEVYNETYEELEAAIERILPKLGEDDSSES
ncbi:low molecular weight protein arginine phosphatase [Salisediminibacterium halotolerans]|uniref:arsenate reductase/protein-tyrosine-phosphatase family protein n=1 Tax=Salisediminibacterium halotolerans TaxID=517425 RepID=UPI000EB0DDEF|nr:low molecular weight protein arginine phosphatase [Salisediminibacterium halotolerans]RLJ75811.1 protein-tyrosine phosphatase [Actinophytocola xinjiangensis]RPE89665.1 protein-tyrosine phosphatase [Salisediminibacterium halotolerans]TWG36424.1 protein-tyrosine phosphatase [Salisediminibacterium halotolerans]GEL08390.1 protein-tyrosine-phosphatase [Salisediminibacterium halotolerans]